MRPAYRTGSSSEALAAARRTQLHRGLGLVLGVFTLYALVSTVVPEWLVAPVGGGLQVGELAAVAQVLAVAFGVFRHDRHARQHIEPLAQRVSTRETGRYGERFTAPARSARGSAKASATGAVTGSAGPATAARPAERPDDSAEPALLAAAAVPTTAAAAYATEYATEYTAGYATEYAEYSEYATDYAADPSLFGEPETAATSFNAFDSPKTFARRAPAPGTLGSIRAARATS